METLESLIRRNACTSRTRYDTAKLELIGQLDNVHRLTSDSLRAVTDSQAFHVWWDMVLMQADKYQLDIEQALGMVRAWAARYVDSEPARPVPTAPADPISLAGPVTPAVLFEHALAHTGRAAARRFLIATNGSDEAAVW